jgi:hypothetical protein
VRIDSPFQRSAPARVGGAIVTFEPGARTAWHTHPLGQTLIVGYRRMIDVSAVRNAAAPDEVGTVGALLSSRLLKRQQPEVKTEK